MYHTVDPTAITHPNLRWAHLFAFLVLTAAVVTFGYFTEHGTSRGDRGLKLDVITSVLLGTNSSNYGIAHPRTTVIASNVTIAWFGFGANLAHATYCLAVSFPYVNRWYNPVVNNQYNPWRWLSQAIIRPLWFLQVLGLAMGSLDIHLGVMFGVCLVILGVGLGCLGEKSSEHSTPSPLTGFILWLELGACSIVWALVLCLVITTHIRTGDGVPWYCMTVVFVVIVLDILTYVLGFLRLTTSYEWLKSGEGFVVLESMYLILTTVCNLVVLMVTYAGYRAAPR